MSDFSQTTVRTLGRPPATVKPPPRAYGKMCKLISVKPAQEKPGKTLPPIAAVPNFTEQG
jgi:hypothetical protein